MSEYDQIWRDFRQARTLSETDHMQPLKVCVMGEDTYVSFLGALQLYVKHSRMIPTQEPRGRVGPIEFEGVLIYPCSHPKTGYFFGYVDENVVL